MSVERRPGVRILVTLTMGLAAAACSGPAASSVESRPTALAVEPARPSGAAALPPPASPAPGPAVTPSVTARVTPPPRPSAPIQVKRLVVARGVHDREPVPATEPPRADGTPIYAFAELSNPDGESENVRVTFERRGGKERAGDVVLPVPGKVARHRTWAFTRHIFAPGPWDVVLRSASGAELGRVRFEVTNG